MFVLPVGAQNFCANEYQYFLENFGDGTDISSNPDVTSYNYLPSGTLNNQGQYRVSNNSYQKSDWHSSADHTGNINGKMMVANGQMGIFYNKIVGFANGFGDGNYSLSMFAMNLNKINNCGGNAILPRFRYGIEYLSENLTWIPLNGSPVSADNLPVTGEPEWVQTGAVFTLPATPNFTVQYLRISIASDVAGDCGNDFAIDDIKLASCPAGGPLPVEFLIMKANLEGSGVGIDWTTSLELNNRYFNVERSIDAGNSWQTIATVRSTGNSASLKSYHAFDAVPVSGFNYYRIKQVDADGRFKYSAVAIVKVELQHTLVTVLTNPFSSHITVDISTKTSQNVQARLFDAAGRSIAVANWNVGLGTNRKMIDNLGLLSRGIYFLIITEADGSVILKEKLLKQ